MALKTIEQADFKDKRVLARFDFNVPLTKETDDSGARVITDSTRIDLALPSIKYILESGARKIILCSHLGRPKGKINKKFSLEPVARYLAVALGMEVILTETAIDDNVDTLLGLPDTKIVLLENLRFHEDEEKNGADFAAKLASYADIYVNDAFGAAHRKHASTYGINTHFKNKAYAGFLFAKEVSEISKLMGRPEKPFMAIIGGAKVSDKIKTIEKLMVCVDKIFIGGAMAYPFLKAKGFEVGKSLCGDEDVALAKRILSQDKGKKITLPVDHIVSTDFEGDPSTTAGTDIDENMMGLDIGPATMNQYREQLLTAKTIFWNGPMGIFENEKYAKGTFTIAQTLSESTAFTVVGGGDSVSALKKSGLSDKISHVSTGGGASLEYIESGDLPGLFALKFGVKS
ncbi:MAG: phosphoglycerate kinase [Bacteriovoracaceae bacterium]|jgi:phosphoglycerate kinase|nr:phosphoglycerate kinase [Bacteriovoracaceae bacterium]